MDKIKQWAPMGGLHRTRVRKIGTKDIENKWIWLNGVVIGRWIWRVVIWRIVIWRIILIGNLVVRIMIYIWYK